MHNSLIVCGWTRQELNESTLFLSEAVLVVRKKRDLRISINLPFHSLFDGKIFPYDN